MRRFRFPLAGLERLLGHREDEAKLCVARAAAERRRTEGVLEHVHRVLLAARQEHRERRAGEPLPLHEELAYQAYFQGIGRVLIAQEEKASQARERHEIRRRELREAATRRRVIGLLRERRKTEHDRTALRELTRLLDEAGARGPRGDGPAGPSPAA